MSEEYKGRLAYWQAKAQLSKNNALMGRDKANNLIRMAHALEQANQLINKHEHLFPEGDDVA